MSICKVLVLCAALGMALSAQAGNGNSIKARHYSKTQQQVLQQSININKAKAETLETIRGIGSKKAKAIVEYRQKHGNFKSLEDLVKVRGIGEKKLAKIKPFLTV